MRLLVGLILLIGIYACESEQDQSVFLANSSVQLTTPNIQVDSIFFRNKATIKIGGATDKARIVQEGYTNVDVTNKELKVGDSRSMTFQSKGGGFKPSEPITVEMFRMKDKQPRDFSGCTLATTPYNTNDISILGDQIKGSKDFRSNAWLGYKENKVVFNFNLNGKDNCEGIGLSFLQDQASWIFGPTAVTAIFRSYDSSELDRNTTNYDSSKQQASSQFGFLKCTTNAENVDVVSIEIQCLEAIPDWHPGAGNNPWLFIDEIIIL